jgi:molybdenum cofactor cytidylyltransferase
MIGGLSKLFNLGERELVAFIGAGGKTTLLLRLGAELVDAGGRIVLTTTTKLGSDEVTGTVCRSADPSEVDACFTSPGHVFVVISDDGRKVTGPSARGVDRLFTETATDYVLVEADGARRRFIKAPADHEPVIPSASTLVVIVASLDAIGRPLAEVAHRPELASGLIGIELDAAVEPKHVAALLAHPQGGLKGVPDRARAVVALTGGKRDGREEAAAGIRDQIEAEGGTIEVTLVPPLDQF